MDAATNAKIAHNLLRGTFGSLDSLLGVRLRFRTSDPVEGDTALLARWCAEYPVWMHARIAGGGAVALLWPMAAAARLVGSVGHEDPAAIQTVSGADLAVMKRITDAILGGGAAGLTGLLGERSVSEGASGLVGKGPAELIALLGRNPAGVEVTYEGGSVNGHAILVISQELEKRVATKLDRRAMEGAVVSDEEVKDILTGFTPEADTDRTGGRNGGEPAPENLDVIMDIELTATARLGKVEVPLVEVLNYGPGSIIELGHLVDEPVELLVNGKLIARGDVVVVDEKFGLRITEIISPQERIESLR